MTTYQQALDDFGIIPLLQKLILMTPVHLESEERESLAALLITQLTASLTHQSIANYLNAIEQGNQDMIADRIIQELQATPVTLSAPTSLPKESSASFEIGDRVQWKSLAHSTRDWGIIIGRFYTYGRHRLQWGWQYVVWLDEESPSSAWTVADTAWEEDLQRLNG
ncbi:MAG: hypothetical protein RIE73_05030 [Coleofasciculus sp. C1-SOL-03]|jgi:hypothetical protein|uniref:hypothetical protein n=1 Tax=Coleofasciculus sp. C1-SOL-03 TaxID=3069522 RepID=UPI003301FED2